MLVVVALVAAALLAFANGANDNFKGVATLFGSNTTSYRGALGWATAMTFIGSVTGLCLAGTLVARFSGRGLVPDTTVADPRFACAVASAAGLTVLLATRLGFPISTTHALVGALSGAALSSNVPIQWEALNRTLVLPLIASPFVALVGTAALYPALSRLRCRLGIDRKLCACIGQEIVPLAPIVSAAPLLASAVTVPTANRLSATVATETICRERYAGRLLGLEAGRTLDLLHLISAGLVSLARGLNDTPKIAALLLVVPIFREPVAVVLCGVLMALGGLAAAGRVAESMSNRITGMNAGQGFTANLTTGLLVICASHWGLPVSTTHVSCGAIFGIGLANGRAHWRFIAQVLTAWITTLPVSLALGWSIHEFLDWFNFRLTP